MFLAMLDEHGFAGRYDFVYLPCDFYRQANLGYAFVNLVDDAAVDALWQTFHGFSGWSLPTAKVCQVSWSGPHQGFKAHSRLLSCAAFAQRAASGEQAVLPALVQAPVTVGKLA
ncbi:ML4, partial [Symbiodinium microadriaticum]